MSDLVPISQKKLPAVSVNAIWDDNAGLFVSPLNQALPEHIADRAKPSTDRHYHLPRLLEDHDIYLAFFPKRLPRSHFFAPLAVGPKDLVDRITPLPDGLGYMLDQETVNQWSDIEDGLLSIFNTLYNEHPNKSLLPDVVWPGWPEHEGYRASHTARETAFNCAKRAQRAFVALSACLSFVISLWLDENEYLCFNRAWMLLSNRKIDPLPFAYLDKLRDSVVCNFNAGFRPGGFLNPYTTRWAPFMPYFVRARVPFWFIWGHPAQYNNPLCVDDGIQERYLPSPEAIKAARHQKAMFAATVLPRMESYGSTSIAPANQAGQGRTDAPRPEEAPPPPQAPSQAKVNKGSGQHIGETWEAFEARLKSAFQIYLKAEKPKDKQARLAREQNATKHGVSNSSKVFSWEQDEEDKSFYRRTLVVRGEAQDSYAEARPYQRFYWGHLNQWDLVLHLPPPPGAIDSKEDESDDDLDYEGISSQPPAFGANNPEPPSLSANNPARLGDVFTRAMNAGAVSKAGETASTLLPPSPIPSLKEYLFLRHGFAVSENVDPALLHPEHWNPQLHTNTAFEKTAINKVLWALLYSNVDLTSLDTTSIVNCVNVMSNRLLSRDSLTREWDIWRDLRLNLQLLDLRIVRTATGPVYILRPPQHSKDDAPWYIALRSPTAVLLVFRQGWEMMLEIARGLLELGIPFRTVIERYRLPPLYDWKEEPKALGIRPTGYVPTKEDYEAYVECRTEILESCLGRAIRLRGGLAGRIASEIVPEIRVLEGPTYGDEVVARDGSVYYLDDGVAADTLDCISGVYHIYNNKAENSVSHSSWWPKQDVFMASGRFSDQWTPDAEGFYTTRLARLDSGVFGLQATSHWRNNLKQLKKRKDEFIAGSERLASLFIAACYSERRRK